MRRSGYPGIFEDGDTYLSQVLLLFISQLAAPWTGVAFGLGGFCPFVALWDGFLVHMVDMKGHGIEGLVVNTP